MTTTKKQTFADLKNDFAFKKTFASEECKDLPIWKDSNSVVKYFFLHDEEDIKTQLDYINLIFVRLSKFNKTLEECETLYDQLLFTFQHAAELNKKPRQLKGKFFEKLFDILKFANFNNMERSLYESRLKAARDEYAQRKWALEKGLMEGREKGLQEGMRKGEAKARNELFALLESGVSLAEAKKMFNHSV